MDHAHRPAALLIGAVAIAHATAPPGPRLSLIRVNLSRTGGTGIDLVTAGPRGGSRQLATGSSTRRGVVPVTRVAWSPDGQTIAFGGSKYVGAVDSDLYLVGADGTGLRRLTRSGDIGAPVFSVDGATIFFPRVPSGGIWAVDSDGTDLRQLTAAQPFVYDSLASISPSGDTLALSRMSCRLVGGAYRCGSSAQLLSLSTGEVRLLAQGASDPVFSPDGLRVALTSTRDHNGQVRIGLKPVPAAELYLLDLASGAMTRLTWSRDLDEQVASWDPSGQRIAFEREDAIGYSRTLEVNADGSCRLLLFGKKVRRGDVEFAAPAWQPGAGREAGRISC